MTRRHRVESLLEEYGYPVEVRAADTVQQVCAVIQPLGYRNRDYPEQVQRPEGIYETSHFLYIGPLSCRLDQLADPVVLSQGREYSVRSAQVKELAGEMLYLWAVLQRQAVSSP